MSTSLQDIYRRGYEHFNRGAFDEALADFSVARASQLHTAHARAHTHSMPERLRSGRGFGN